MLEQNGIAASGAGWAVLGEGHVLAGLRTREDGTPDIAGFVVERNVGGWRATPSDDDGPAWMVAWRDGTWQAAPAPELRRDGTVPRLPAEAGGVKGALRSAFAGASGAVRSGSDFVRERVIPGLGAAMQPDLEFGGAVGGDDVLAKLPVLKIRENWGTGSVSLPHFLVKGKGRQIDLVAAGCPPRRSSSPCSAALRTDGSTWQRASPPRCRRSCRSTRSTARARRTTACPPERRWPTCRIPSRPRPGTTRRA